MTKTTQRYVTDISVSIGLILCWMAASGCTQELDTGNDPWMQATGQPDSKVSFSLEPWYIVEGMAREINLWHPDDNAIQLGQGRAVISIRVEEFVDWVSVMAELDEGVTLIAFMEGFYRDPANPIEYDTDRALSGTEPICASACARNIDDPRRLFVMQEGIPLWLTLSGGTGGNARESFPPVTEYWLTIVKEGEGDALLKRIWY